MVKPEGESGWPELIPEKYYFASNIVRPKVGDFIVFKNPRQESELLIKKVMRITEEFYFVTGTVSWSSFGPRSSPVPKKHVLGRLM